MSQFKAHLREAIDSLIMEPEDWEITKRTAINHRRRIGVWHGNRYYGVDFVVGDAYYGGVTYMAVIFDQLIPWRRRLCRAVDSCVKMKQFEQLEKTHG